MTSKAIRRSWLATWVLVLAVVTTPAMGLADICDSVPDCQQQVQAPVSYAPWQTQGWAYYCTGTHPFYWGLGQTGVIISKNFSFDNSCFTVTENPFAEEPISANLSKFDATITNWCLSHQFITVTLGCSTQAPMPGC